MAAPIQVVFINYYYGNLLPDGFIVNVYPVGVTPSPSNLIDTAIIGAFPSPTNSGEASFSNLNYNTLYQIRFIGNNPPTGSHYLPVMESNLLTVPIFNGVPNIPAVYTTSSNSVQLVGPGSIIYIPVYNTSPFTMGYYVIFSGITGVFIGIVSTINALNNTIGIVVTELLVGNVGDTVNQNAFISQFIPDDFRGLQGIPGVNGNGSTLTTANITLPTVGEVISFSVLNGSAFPNYTNLLVSDNTNTFTAYVSGGGTTNNLTTYVTSVSGFGSIASNAIVTFTGQQGIEGIQGLTGDTGESGMSIVGPVGPSGSGPTITTAPFTCTMPGSSYGPVIINVEDNSAFPINSYFLATNGTDATIIGQVISLSSNNQIIFNMLESTVGQILTTGSIVTFSGPPGPPGPQSVVPGPPGYGLPGHGATSTTQPTLIPVVGSLTNVYVVDSLGFPPLSYVLVSDGIYSLTGQVAAQTTNGQPIFSPIQGQSLAQSSNINQLVIRVNNITNGMPGLTIQPNAAVTYSGPPGLAGSTNVGDLGTSLFFDMPLVPPVSFSTGSQGILNPSVIDTFTFRLPNNQPIQYRVVAEFTGNVITNQVIVPSTNIAYVGLTSTAATGASNTASTFAGFYESNIGPIAAPVINLPKIVADGSCTINTVSSNNANNNLIVKFIGTFYAGVQIDFSVVSAALQLNTTLWVSGMLTVNCYPIYM